MGMEKNDLKLQNTLIENDINDNKYIYQSMLWKLCRDNHITKSNSSCHTKIIMLEVIPVWSYSLFFIWNLCDWALAL